MQRFNRRLPVGAEVQATGGVHFRVWAPASQKVAVSLIQNDDRADTLEVALHAEEGGYWSGHVAEARAGMLYRYRLESGAFPDPASRFQPQGPHGASRIIDPAAFAWTDHEWPGVAREGQVIYEMHIGTFTREGLVGSGDGATTASCRTRRHGARSHARRRLSGPLRLGLRRSKSFRANAALRRAGRLSPFR